MKVFVILAVVGIAAAQLVHHRPIQISWSESQHRPIQIQTPPIEVIPRQPNVDEWPSQWPKPEHPLPINPEFPSWNWQHEQPIQPIQPFPEFDFNAPRLPPWVERPLPLPENQFPELNVHPVPEQRPDAPAVIVDLPRWTVNIPHLRPQPEPEQPVQRPNWPNLRPEPEPELPVLWPNWLQPETVPEPRPQWPNMRPQPEPLPEAPVQRPQWPNLRPEPEPEPPVMWPNWPQPEPIPPVQWPTFPREPVPPRANWREGRPDPRCPAPDNHDSEAFFLPGDGQWSFFMCWGQIAWPFTCPEGTVFRSEVNVCADPGWTPEFGRMRPFNEEEEPVPY